MPPCDDRVIIRDEISGLNLFSLISIQSNISIEGSKRRVMFFGRGEIPCCRQKNYWVTYGSGNIIPPPVSHSRPRPFQLPPVQLYSPQITTCRRLEPPPESLTRSPRQLSLLLDLNLSPLPTWPSRVPEIGSKLSCDYHHRASRLRYLKSRPVGGGG